MAENFSGDSLKTAAKLVVLEETLDIYTTIINANWEVQPWYIDTHAGSGKTEIDNGRTVDGSTLVALDEFEDQIERFYFYELNKCRFHRLHESITKKFGYEFDISSVKSEGHDFLVARHDDPYIRILNQDSNTGVQFLVDELDSSRHWFTFIDPEGLTARRETLDALIERGNVDILLNYQSEGVMRSAAADHAQGAVTRQHGDDDWPEAASPDEYVASYREKLEGNDEIPRVVSQPMQDPNSSKGMRFDLVFACRNERVTEIIEERMEQDELWDKAYDKLGQSGLGDFI